MKVNWGESDKVYEVVGQGCDDGGFFWFLLLGADGEFVQAKATNCHCVDRAEG